MSNFPAIIQGGMGAGVSSWRLAQAVSKLGQLRRGFRNSPRFDSRPALTRRRSRRPHAPRSRSFSNSRNRRAYLADVLHRRRKTERAPYKALPSHSKDAPRELQELCVVANFVEVFLAREGHNHPVGINYLEKVQLPHLPSIYGAMLAGVGYILMGAGVPLKIPGVLDRFANHEPATYLLQVNGAQEDDDRTMFFAPKQLYSSTREVISHHSPGRSS